MIKKRPKCILFDFDRTMVFLYSNRNLLSELGRLMTEFYCEYIPIEYDYAKDGYFVWHEAHREVEKKYDSVKALEINRKAEQIVTSFEMKLVKEKQLFGDVVDTIKKMYEKGVYLGIVSSNSTSIIKEKLKCEGIIECFKVVYGREIPFDPDKLKPSSYPLISAINELGFDKTEVWYVGDDIIDIDAARRAGISVVGMATGNYTMEELCERGADITADSMKSLYKYFEILEI